MNWNVLLNRYNFLQLYARFCIYPTPGCYTGKMLFANASKIIRNCFSTPQPDNYLQFTKVGTRKGMDVIWALDAIYYICLCTNLLDLFIYAFVWKKEKLHQNSYSNFISKAINIDFQQIWHFDVKGTGWVGL